MRIEKVLTTKFNLLIGILIINLLSVSVAAQEKVTIGKDGQNDFDAHFGTWHTKLKRLKSPLSGSAIWVAYEGTTKVTGVCDGKANLVELNVEGPSGNIVGMSLRLYNPETKQWSLNFASIQDGVLTPPTIGGFKNGKGEFFNEDTFNDQKILVRFVISKISKDAIHFEQSFSVDNGKTWEINWIADDTRI